MDNAKYIGMDVHKETISIAVLDSSGKLVMESVIETKGVTIVQFIRGLRGELHVTFEEGSWAAWLYDLLKPYVHEVLVCDPRKNALLKTGNKSDKIDARKLAELLYLNRLTPVYHGEHGVRALKELSRSYLTISGDAARVMTRLKAVYRSWAIPCAGKQVYAPRYRDEWLGKIREAGVRRRAELYYQELEELRSLRQQVRRELLAESAKHNASKLLCQIPSIGPIRAVNCHPTDTPSLSQQAAIVGLWGPGHRDTQQRRSSLRRWAPTSVKETRLAARAQPQSQPRTEKYFQGCGHHRRHRGGAFPGILRGTGGQGNPAGDGTADPGTQNRRDHFGRLEERSDGRPVGVVVGVRNSLSLRTR
jgi:hypothetical protein